MSDDLFLRRKLTLRAHGKQVVLVKRANEHATHVLMKAFLWALYLPTYPHLLIEMSIGDRYKPDVVEPGAPEHGQPPRFWGEAGQVTVQKIRSLARRYRGTHFALARWDTRLDTVVQLVTEALAGLRREAPFDVLTFPPDSATRFIDSQGEMRLTYADLTWEQIAPSHTSA